MRRSNHRTFERRDGRALRLSAPLLLCAAFAVLAPAALPATRPDGRPETTAEFLEREIGAFSDIPSRLSGTPGCDQAAEYVAQRFRDIGLKNVTAQPFDVVVPITKRSSMLLGPRQTPVEIHPLWPNWVRTCSTPGPIAGPVIYAYDGDLRKVRGLPIEGAIVILDHNTGAVWETFAMLGARALIFVEPPDGEATRRDAELKFLREPLNIPRFWVPRAGKPSGAAELLAQVEAGQKAGKPIQATLDCRVDWEKRTARNIIGLLEGVEGTVESGNFIAYTAHYDSMSIAPDLSPGANEAASIAALLRLAERLSQNRGRESVLFIAFAGHYEGLSGASWFADSLAFATTPDEGEKESELALRIRKVEGSRIDSASRVEYYEGIAERVRSVAGDLTGLATLAGQTLPSVRAVLPELRPLAPPDAYARIDKLIEDLAAKKLLGEATRKDLLKRVSAERESARRDRLTRFDDPHWAACRDIIGDIAEPLTTRVTWADRALGLVEDLKKKISGPTLTTNSHATYDELLNTISSALRAEVLTPGAERRLRFTVERQQDADRHLITHRFELTRLRKHAAFLRELGIDPKKRLRLVLSLDLCSDGWRFGMFATGENGFISGNVSDQVIYGGLMQRMWQIGRKRMDDVAPEPGKEVRLYERIVFPARSQERMQGGASGYFSGRMAFDSEFIQLAGREALALATVDSGRRATDTPSDTIERMKRNGGVARLATQTDVLGELAETLAGDEQAQGLFQTLDDKRAGGSATLIDAYCRVNGRVVRYDPVKSMGIADLPVPGSLCVSRFWPGGWGVGEGAQTYAGVRDGYFTFADEGGTYELLGLPKATARLWNMKDFIFEAYRFDANGELDHAPDYGLQGAGQFKFVLPTIPKDDQEVTVPVFRCRPIGLLGFTDPTTQRAFSGLGILDANNTAPDFYGQLIYPGSGGGTHGLPAGVVFLEPPRIDKKTGKPVPVQFRIQFSSGVLGPSLPLLNMRPGHLEEDGPRAGAGYDIPAAGILADARRLMTRDVVLLDDYRIASLKSHAVENARVNELHFGRKDAQGRIVTEGSKSRLEKAEQARAGGDYAGSSVLLEAAYAMEARAYPIIKGTTTDILGGVLFYLFLLLPFSYFVERLLFGFPDVNKRIVAFFAIFIVVFVVLALVHPAFSITQSAPVILIAFIALALSFLVISMIRGRFELEVKRLHERPGARRETDFTRAGATSAACALGIGNMRRRKVRTSLTLVTLVLLTFSVLSFTSVEPRQITHVNPNPTGEQIVPPYPGILLRDYRFNPIPLTMYHQALYEFSAQATIVPRCWLGSDALVQSARDYRREFLCTGVVGLTPDEARITKTGGCLRAGRWFQAGDARCAIIGQRVAKEVGIAVEEVTGDAAAAPRVRALGVELPVIGITDDERFKSLKDVDGERLSPIDRRIETWKKRSGKKFDPYAVETYAHVTPESCIFVPYDFLMNSGGDLISVAVVTASSGAAEKIGDDLLSRLTVPIYISTGSAVRYCLSSDANRVRGFGSMIVPMLICALIVLNTMLGSVYERQREISIFGSLGLAPIHIGALFMAESAVFATVAVILGYVLGQITSFLLTANKLIEGFSLNYSSTSAVISAAAVMALVLLSTLYPARKASQLSVPDVERIWKLPPPEGDDFHIRFPFTIGGQQAYGMNMYLLEYFRDHANQSVGDFFTQDNMLTLESGPGGGHIMRFDSQVWIAPFDFGISQSMILRTVPTDEPGIFAPEMHLHRKSGEPSAWARMNHRFLRLIRQQFLTWRILTPGDRALFAAQAKEHLGIADDADRRVLDAALAALARKPEDESASQEK